MSKNMTFDEISADVEIAASKYTLQRWLDRGDGIAMYENMAMDSMNIGHKKWVSYGSPSAQIEMDEPPQRLPDIGGQINWAYQLVGVCRNEK